jgi:hypothetical protein
MDRPADLKIGALYYILWFDNTENILQYSEQEVFTYPRTSDRIFELFWVIASNGGLEVPDVQHLSDAFIQPRREIDTATSAQTFQEGLTFLGQVMIGQSTICPVWERVQSCTIMNVKELPLYLNWKKGYLFDKLLKGSCDDLSTQ